MTFVRWQNWIMMMGLVVLPACDATRPFRAQPPAPPSTPTVQPAISEFKALSPGQRIAKPDVVVVAPEVSSDSRDLELPSIAPAAPTPVQPKSADDVPFDSLLEPRLRGPRPDNPLVAALRAHLDNQYASAVGHLASFDRPNQELLLILLPILDSARTTDLSGRDPSATAVLTRQLESAVELISKNAPLEIRTAAFVYRVVQFGVYDPLPAGHRFLPGGIGLLYAEIDHVPVLPATQANGERSFVTRLDGTIQLRDAEGKTVELYDNEKNKMVSELPFARTDFTRSPVRDFFLKIEFPVPTKPGKYSLALEIRDPTSKNLRRTRKVVEFQVGN